MENSRVSATTLYHQLQIPLTNVEGEEEKFFKVYPSNVNSHNSHNRRPYHQ